MAAAETPGVAMTRIRPLMRRMRIAMCQFELWFGTHKGLDQPSARVGGQAWAGLPKIGVEMSIHA